MSDLLLSIIIPVYNVKNYLRECLDSVVRYQNESYEIVLVNDGSTDDSGLICSEYANKYDNIVYIIQDNAGLSAARNTGIKIAKGKYLFFLDSDDFVDQGGIERLLEQIKSKNPDLFFIRSKSFQDGTYNFVENQIGYLECKQRIPLKVFSQLDARSDFWFAAWLVVINRDFLLNNNLYFYEGIYHEDELWVPLVFSRVQRAVLINNCLYCYRENRKDSIVNKANIKKEFDKIIVMDHLRQEAVLHKGSERNILLKRCAALEWGILLNAEKYSDDNRYAELCKEVYDYRRLLKIGKYWVPYIALIAGDFIQKHIGKTEVKEIAFVKQMRLFQ